MSYMSAPPKSFRHPSVFNPTADDFIFTKSEKSNYNVYNVKFKGASVITGAPLTAIYPCTVRKNAKFPGKPAATACLKAPSMAEIAAYRAAGKPLTSAMEFRLWTERVRDAQIEAIFKNKTVAKSITKIANPTLEDIGRMFKTIVMQPGEEDKLDVDAINFKIMTTLKPNRVDPPLEVMEVDQNNYNWDAKFFEATENPAGGPPIKTEVDYNETPKHKCIQPGTLVLPNFAFAYTSEAMKDIRAQLKIVSAFVVQDDTDYNKETDVDQEMLKKSNKPVEEANEADDAADFEGHHEPTVEAAGEKRLHSDDEPLIPTLPQDQFDEGDNNDDDAALTAAIDAAEEDNSAATKQPKLAPLPFALKRTDPSSKSKKAKSDN